MPSASAREPDTKSGQDIFVRPAGYRRVQRLPRSLDHLLVGGRLRALACCPVDVEVKGWLTYAAVGVIDRDRADGVLAEVVRRAGHRLDQAARGATDIDRLFRPHHADSFVPDSVQHHHRRLVR